MWVGSLIPNLLTDVGKSCLLKAALISFNQLSHGDRAGDRERLGGPGGWLRDRERAESLTAATFVDARAEATAVLVPWATDCSEDARAWGLTLGFRSALPKFPTQSMHLTRRQAVRRLTSLFQLQSVHLFQPYPCTSHAGRSGLRGLEDGSDADTENTFEGFLSLYGVQPFSVSRFQV